MRPLAPRTDQLIECRQSRVLFVFKPPDDLASAMRRQALVARGSAATPASPRHCPTNNHIRLHACSRSRTGSRFAGWPVIIDERVAPGHGSPRHAGERLGFPVMTADGDA